ncbi:MAG: dTMP kinase [Pirellulales bacterium]
MFVTFDGVDGAGKTTQIALFVEWLKSRGHEVVLCRDPGSTSLGNELRKILLHGNELHIDGRAEMFLYMAARAQLVAEVIRPAIAANRIVVSDRFLLANIVYQGYAGGLGPDLVRNVGEQAVDGVKPHLTLVLDMPAEAAAARIDRQLDRMESKGLDYLRAVREGFLAEARLDPERLVLIDAQGTREEVRDRILDAAIAHGL